MRQEIYSAYDTPFPKIPGKTVRFFQEKGSSVIEAEVFDAGSEFPEWSTEQPRLEKAVSKVCKQYGVPAPVLRRAYSAEEV